MIVLTFKTRPKNYLEREAATFSCLLRRQWVACTDLLRISELGMGGVLFSATSLSWHFWKRITVEVCSFHSFCSKKSLALRLERYFCSGGKKMWSHQFFVFLFWVRWRTDWKSWKIVWDNRSGAVGKLWRGRNAVEEEMHLPNGVCSTWRMNQQLYSETVHKMLVPFHSLLILPSIIIS